MRNANWALVFASVLLAGCGITKPIQTSQSKLTHLYYGQPQSEVMDLFGKPAEIPEVSYIQGEPPRETFIYEIYPPRYSIVNAVLCPFSLTLTCWFPSFPFYGPTDYVMKFENSRLIEWGRAQGATRTSNHSVACYGVGCPTQSIPNHSK